MIETVVLGFFFGVLINVSGIGAGVVVVPALMLIKGLPPSEAIAVGATFSVLAKASISVGHLFSKRINTTLAKEFLIYSAPLTCVVAAALSAMANHVDQAQFSAIATTLLITAASMGLIMMFRPFRQLFSRLSLRTSAVLTGLVVGATGAGGGILVVPALLTSAKLPIKEAIATSVPIGLILSALTAFGFASGGHLDLSIVLTLFAGCLVSLPVGQWVAHRLPEELTLRITMALIFVSIVGLFIRAI